MVMYVFLFGCWVLGFGSEIRERGYQGVVVVLCGRCLWSCITWWCVMWMRGVILSVGGSILSTVEICLLKMDGLLPYSK